MVFGLRPQKCGLQGGVVMKMNATLLVAPGPGPGDN